MYVWQQNPNLMKRLEVAQLQSPTVDLYLPVAFVRSSVELEQYVERCERQIHANYGIHPILKKQVQQ